MLQWKYGFSEILICGHSLGGALSVICGLDFALNPISEDKPTINVITFGAPRSGNCAFAWLFNRMVPNHIRMVHEHDVVPK